MANGRLVNESVETCETILRRRFMTPQNCFLGGPKRPMADAREGVPGYSAPIGGFVPPKAEADFSLVLKGLPLREQARHPQGNFDRFQA